MLIGSIALSLFILFTQNYWWSNAISYVNVFVIALMSAALIFFPGPSALAVFIAGKFLDPIATGLLAGFGSAIGESTAYIAGRGSNVFHRLQSFKKILWFEKYLKINTFVFIIIIALIPNPIADLAGIVTGRLKYPYLKFFLATFIGKAIRFIIFAQFSSYFF